MKKRLITLAALPLLLGFSNLSLAGGPDGWVTLQPPELYSPQWSAANRSDAEWRVESDSGIKLSPSLHRTSVELNYQGGILRGLDRGEWGGELSFLPEGLEQRKEKVTDGNIVAIFEQNHRIYVLEGLAHMSIRCGRMLRVEKTSSGWKCETVLDLQDAPATFLRVGDTLYIVTFGKLLKVQDEAIQEVMIDNAFWQSLYPNSMIMVNEELWIGMRGGIAKVNCNTKEMVWMVRRKP